MTLKSEKGSLGSVEYYYEMLAALKHFKRKLLTNFYLSVSQLAESISYGEVWYEYKEEAYLNLIIQDDGFFRLYYFIADIENYQFQYDGIPCVCDIFFNEQTETSDRVSRAVRKAGFREYAAFSKWACKSPITDVPVRNDLRIVRQGSKEVMDILFQYFDSYTDYLPRKRELSAFLSEKEFFCAYDERMKTLAGALIFTPKERTITEEFLFVRNDLRGKRISEYLYCSLYRLFENLNLQYIAWIQDNNIPCITLHEKYSYHREKMKKITFLKG